MLADHRFDMFPRGVVEITHEIKAFQPSYPNMRIDSHLLIRYPYAQFFYVSKSDPLLAKRIRDGLEAMLKDGSFEALFREHFAQGIADLHLERRVVIDLKNPLLPAMGAVGSQRTLARPVRRKESELMRGSGDDGGKDFLTKKSGNQPPIVRTA